MAGRGDRWDRDRFMSERERDRFPDEQRRTRFDDTDHVYERRTAATARPRERSDERFDRGYRAFDDDFVRDRRQYDDEPRFSRRDGPPDYDRRVVTEREREVVRDLSPAPAPVSAAPRRPGTLLRRQSSLDTFDRRPLPRFYDREEYGPPARRDDYRAPAYVPIPLPRTKALPSPRRHPERETYDDIRIAEPDLYGDEEFRSYPDRVREREVIRTRRRNRSRDSHTSKSYSHRSSSRSSSTTSRSSSNSGTTVHVGGSEYPKKGKTRIPARLVSVRAVIDLGYPYLIEGTTLVVLKALGQHNIDELLKLSEDYKKSELELELANARPVEFVEDRRDEVYIASAAPPPTHAVSHAPAPVIIDARPHPTADVYTSTTIVRDVSPARSCSSYTTSSTRTPVLVERHEVSNDIGIGPLALAQRRRSTSRPGRDIRSEIRALESQLKHGRHDHRDIVRAERLSDGQIVLFEERVEKIEEGKKGPRIEKDKKGPPPSLMRAMLATLT